MSSTNGARLSRLVTLLLVIAAFLVGQTQTATLRGVLQDASGAVLPGAKLTLTNVDQNRSWNTTTNAVGVYIFLQIPPGRYALAAEADGFKRLEQRGLTLEVAQIAALDLTLELGAVSETVQVTGAAPLLETASSTLGETVNALTTENLPLNGRNVLQLVALTPGINATRSYRNASSGSGSIASNGFSANGGRNVSNSIMLDGSPQEVMGYNQPAYVPSPDAVQEFRVQTNSLSAEYGRTGGAVINMVHRSGSSQFHGVLYEFLRNDALDANGFFNNLTGQNKAPFRYNQFGATLGGPLTPSRQTTFFFFNYEGIRQKNPGDDFFTVPTAKMKQGDFSEAPFPIYDPATIDSKGERQQFPNNQIPVDRFDPVAKKIISFYPEPNRTGIVNNYFSQKGSTNTSDNVSVKVDRRLTQNNNLFGRYSWNDVNQDLANHFNSIASPNAGFSGARNRSVTLDDTHALATWVLHANYGYAYHSNPRRSPDEEVLPSSLGFPGYMDPIVQYRVFPRIEPGGYDALGGNSSFIIGNEFETHTGSADASKLISRHSIKFGGTYRVNRVSNKRPNSPAGHFTFNNTWTRKVFNKGNEGDSIASLLLGLPAGNSLRYEPDLAIQVKYYALYLQDDWRVNDRLTLNVGLRWDADMPLTERFNRTSWFDFDAPLPVTVPGVENLRGGLRFAGVDGNPRGNKDADLNNFAPRIGFAFRLTDRFVMRSGFGIFFNPTTGIGPSANSTGALSFNAITPIVSSNDGGRTPVATLSNPFPNGFSQPENGANGLLTFLGQNINGQVRNDRTPYSAQWNYDLQYEIANNMLIDAAYAGSAGVGLLANVGYNQLPDQYLALTDQLTASVPNPFFGIIPANTSLGGRTTTYGQLLRPYPQFNGVTQQWGSVAHSSYHALQTKFRKRYGAGLQFLVAYTWSKTIDDVSSVAGFLGQQNPGYTNNNNRRLDRSLSALDVAHNLALNFQWELPFGRGRAWGSGMHPVLNQIIGGWSLNGIGQLQSGLPISISSRNNTTNSFGGAQRPNSTGISSKTEGSDKDRWRSWFNDAAFVDVPPFTFGNVARFLPDNRGPKYHSWDISLLKNFPVTESVRVQLRGEFFNAFNNVNFNSPSGTTFGSPGFGTITNTEPARIIQLGLKLYY